MTHSRPSIPVPDCIHNIFSEYVYNPQIADWLCSAFWESADAEKRAGILTHNDVLSRHKAVHAYLNKMPAVWGEIVWDSRPLVRHYLTAHPGRSGTPQTQLWEYLNQHFQQTDDADRRETFWTNLTLCVQDFLRTHRTQTEPKEKVAYDWDRVAKTIRPYMPTYSPDGYITAWDRIRNHESSDIKNENPDEIQPDNKALEILELGRDAIQAYLTPVLQRTSEGDSHLTVQELYLTLIHISSPTVRFAHSVFGLSITSDPPTRDAWEARVRERCRIPDERLSEYIKKSEAYIRSARDRLHTEEQRSVKWNWFSDI